MVWDGHLKQVENIIDQCKVHFILNVFSVRIAYGEIFNGENKGRKGKEQNLMKLLKLAVKKLPTSIPRPVKNLLCMLNSA